MAQARGLIGACRSRTALGLAFLLAACGGGGAPSSGSPTPAPVVTAPGPPAISNVVVSDNRLSLTIAPGAGGAAATYTATCTSGIESRSATGSGSPLEVPGLANGVPWSCTVTASNSAGTSTASAAASGTPAAAYEIAAALPVLAIDTPGAQEIVSKDDYIVASYRITGTDGANLASGSTEIRGRGNSTWSYPKKPYRLKLATSTALLGMPANRHWVLLANYTDKTLVRTEMAFDLSERLGMAWTPRSRPVILQVNGDYRGIYQLVEHVRIAKERIDIPELKVGDTSADKISGGYLIEIDWRYGEDYCTDNNRSNAVFCFSNPETLREPGWGLHKAYIDKYLVDTEAALYGVNFADPATGYAAYIDVASAIDWYLINEFVKNVDSNFTGSVFLYKKRDGKLFFGPVWDFDLAIGNADFFSAGTPTGWRTRQAAWFTRMFQDPAFADRVRARWKQLRADGTINGAFATIDRRAAYYSLLQVRNFERWPILDSTIPLIRPVTGPYTLQVSTVKNWLLQRRDWMDSQFQ